MADETILPQTIGVIQHLRSTSPTCQISKVKGIEIFAQWDGLKDDPMDVSIRFTVDARPQSRVRLIKSTDPLLLSHTVRSIDRIPEVEYDAASLVREKHKVHLKELSGDTLTPADAQEYLQAIKNEDNKQSLGSDNHDCSESSSLSCSASVSSYDPNMSTACPLATKLKNISRSSKDQSYLPLEPCVPSAFSAIQATPSKSRDGGSADYGSGYAISKYYGNRPLDIAHMTQTTPDSVGRVKSLELSGNSTPSNSDYHAESSEVIFPQTRGSPHQSGAQASPITSPRLWVNRFPCKQYFADRAWSISQSLKQLSDTLSAKECHNSDSSSISSDQSQTIPDQFIPTRYVGPSTMMLDGALFAHFPDQVAPGTYVFGIDVVLFLAEPDAIGWQEFSIPGLQTEVPSDIMGSLTFVVLPSSNNNPAKVPVQFDFRGSGIVGEVQNRQLKADFPISQRLSLGVRTQAELYHIPRWNSEATTYSTVECDQGTGMRFKHDTSLIVANAGGDFFAQRVSFKVSLRNGPQQGGTFKLGPGECLIQFPDCVFRTMDPERSVELMIERDSQDMGKQIQFLTTCHFPHSRKISVPLPVISTTFGEVRLQRIWLSKPSPPLVLHAVLKEFLSIWKYTKRRIGKREVLCFDRMDTPSLFPDALDDAIVQVHRFKDPVSFLGLGDLHDYTMIEKTSDVIPSLVIDVDIVPGDRLECRLSFDLHIGSSQSLVKMDTTGWHFKYALIDGQLCTREAPRWWEEDTVTHLLKDDTMTPGETVHLDLSFLMMEQMRGSEGDPVRIIYCLPGILDKVIIGGSLTCNLNTSVSFPNVDGKSSHYEDVCFRNRHGENFKRLPILGQNYCIELDFEASDCLRPMPKSARRLPTQVERIRFIGGLPLQLRKLRFADEESDSSDSDSDDEDSETSDADMEHDVPRHRIRDNGVKSQQLGPGPRLTEDEVRALLGGYLGKSKRAKKYGGIPDITVTDASCTVTEAKDTTQEDDDPDDDRSASGSSDHTSSYGADDNDNNDERNNPRIVFRTDLFGFVEDVVSLALLLFDPGLTLFLLFSEYRVRSPRIERCIVRLCLWMMVTFYLEYLIKQYRPTWWIESRQSFLEFLLSPAKAALGCMGFTGIPGYNATVIATEPIVQGVEPLVEAVGGGYTVAEYVNWRDRIDLALGWRRGPG
ncbi:MAG: hypothetical protein Q9222_004202 [Ikaeria aurantiellina]